MVLSPCCWVQNTRWSRFIAASRTPSIVDLMRSKGAGRGDGGRSSPRWQVSARWLAGPIGNTVAAALLAVALRLPFLSVPLAPDEGGYLLVASNWHDDGPYSYGRIFVDRPPFLLLIYRLAVAFGGGPARCESSAASSW